MWSLVTVLEFIKLSKTHGKKTNGLPKRVLKSTNFSHSNLFFLKCHLKVSLEKLAALHLKTKILYSEHMLWPMLMSEEVI